MEGLGKCCSETCVTSSRLLEAWARGFIYLAKVHLLTWRSNTTPFWHFGGSSSSFEPPIRWHRSRQSRGVASHRVQDALGLRRASPRRAAAAARPSARASSRPHPHPSPASGRGENAPSNLRTHRITVASPNRSPGRSPSMIPVFESHASNSGAGRLPSSPRTLGMSWNEVDW